MKNIEQIYQNFCEKKGIKFQLDENVKSYDDTTLFCPDGMQQFKDRFKNPDNTTVANIQSCILLNDLEEIGDGTHMLHFKMIGLFSFGEMKHPFFEKEVIHQKNMKERYEKLIHKHLDKPKEWWFDTHGIDVEDL